MKKVFEDALNLLCGHRIAVGMSREVFECNLRPDLVVKVEKAEVRSHFQNIIEWHVWSRVCGTGMEKWFAPVIEMSPEGRLLLMKRTSHIGIWPTHVPAFFTDLKPGNFGFIDGKFVCHDYGCTLLIERGMTKSMRKVTWSRNPDGSN